MNKTHDMVQNILVKLLLAPFSLLYGLGVAARDQFYKVGLLKSISFNIPVISVGNLSVGGAGKTPHIEYLVHLLKDYLNVATLSRGYKRKTKGFLSVHPKMNAEQAGDEPLQFKRKFPDVFVSVGESRALAIPKIIQNQPETQLVLLDDAFQHRAVTPGLNILLTEYARLFTKDFLLPSGRLREWRYSYKRADIIIVSKCPPQITQEEKEALRKEINPLPHQRLYFSYYQYGHPYQMGRPGQFYPLQKDWDVLLVCAIANSDYLLSYLENQVNEIRAMEYEDHHYFTKHDLGQIMRSFEQMESTKKLLVTTEKDAMRLEMHWPYIVENKIPILILPVRVGFHFEQTEEFNEDIQKFLLEFKT